MQASNLFVSQTLPKQEVVCRYMQTKRPTPSQIIILIVLSILLIISGLIFLSILPSYVNIIISLLCAGMSWCILSFVTAQIIIKYSQPKYKHIPFGFRYVIKSEFPKVFFDLVTKQDLKLANFRELLIYIHDCRESQETSLRNHLHKLSPQLKKILEDFGVDNLDSEVNGQHLPSLDNLLIENCPLYWMKRFIELGNKNVLRENLEKYNRGYSGIYWFCELDAIRQSVTPRTEHGTIFLLQSYGLAQELRHEEYVFLMDQVKNHTWDHRQVTAVVDRLLINAQGDYSRYMGEKDKVELLSELRVTFTEESIKELIFRICSHGISWEQLQLIRSTSLASWQFLCWLDQSAPHGGIRILARSFLGDFISENSLRYESNIALATYSECKNVSRYKSLMNQKTSQAWKTICYYFNHRMKFHEKLEDIEEAYLNRDDEGYN
ncbi:hypothetical protein NVRI1_01008 [Chlamydia abortus]|nr:hypothetical protein NVRI1_01008 [Chlamydia abortus]